MAGEKVLIVDDDIQTLRLVGLMLERQGYIILAANNGIQALQMAKSDHPDIIILDIMMPDLDGYEVARRLRKEPATVATPILMFTARSQVEDKVAGYEAGADDYLTKPIHPAELNARLRALLSRHKAPPAPERKRGYRVGILAAKGGIGVSTLALNLAVTYRQRTKAEVIAAELRPGQGTWGIELGLNKTDGLSSLLRSRPGDLSVESVEKALTVLPGGARQLDGVRLLLASAKEEDTGLVLMMDQLVGTVEYLPLMADLVLLDIGTSFFPGLDKILNHVDEVMVVTEPAPTCLQRTRILVENLGSKGFGRSKLMSVVSINRGRTDFQLSMIQMQEILGLPVAVVIPPAPEIAYQATNRSVPMVQVQPGSVINLQFLNLTERLVQRVPA